MIYTVTFNPSLDYIAGVVDFQTGKVNRTIEEKNLPGGKGINVSIVLNNLGLKSTALGFTAGFTGDEIKKRLKEFQIRDDFIDVRNGVSRINVKLRNLDTTGNGNKVIEESEINGTGPGINIEELNEFYAQIDTLKKDDVLILAGSIPRSLPDTIYRDILEKIEGKEIITVVDATKDLLMNVLSYRPFLIKPNNHELGEIFGVDIKEKDDVILYAKKLQEMGARNVLVSMAGDGAVLVSEDDRAYKMDAPKGNVINSVGAGDSMVAGFVYGYITEGNYEAAFRYGVCAGSASAFSDNLATRDEVDALLARIP